MTIDGADAGNTTYASASHHIHEHRFDIVIAMMSHEDGLGTNVTTQLLEIVVAQLAGCQLNAHLMQ